MMSVLAVDFAATSTKTHMEANGLTTCTRRFLQMVIEAIAVAKIQSTLGTFQTSSVTLTSFEAETVAAGTV
jgi:hypothetical protein